MRNIQSLTEIASIRIGIASPDEIRSWSYGEVKNPETIDYRTFRPVMEGLFCERIFGPIRDWECHCGRYKKVKYKGIICERCGVEVTRSSIRRERMGHIELAAPVCHIWYLKGSPGPLSLLLDIKPNALRKVLYFSSYIVTYVDRLSIENQWSDICQAVQNEIEIGRKQGEVCQQALTLLRTAQPGQLINEEQCRSLERLKEVLVSRLNATYADIVQAGIGGEAIRKLLQQIDIHSLALNLRRELQKEVQVRPRGRPRKQPEPDGEQRNELQKISKVQRDYAVKRLQIVEAFLASTARPEWMILDCIPVLSPELRPMVQLEGGRFATSDLNDLYRRIINRNNRLKKIAESRAPEQIICHEKRFLQEAVDALIDNGSRSRPVVGFNNRPLMSLSDMLKGKNGRFRKNLLGKRVDYSGCSVLVPNPTLKLHQCGLPRQMALELFKLFVMQKLVEHEFTSNIKTAKRVIDKMKPEVWDALEEVVRGRPVLLSGGDIYNRLGIQAFEPVLVDSKAVQVNPLVYRAFGSGDQLGDEQISLGDWQQRPLDGSETKSHLIAVYLPLSEQAQLEGRSLMSPAHNLFSSANGTLGINLGGEVAFGCRYLTDIAENAQPCRHIFASPEEAILAYESGQITLNAPLRVRIRRCGATEIVGGSDEPNKQISVGRLILNQALPPALRHNPKYLYETFEEATLSEAVTETYHTYGGEESARLLESFKDLGLRHATESGRVEPGIVQRSVFEYYRSAYTTRRIAAGQFIEGQKIYELARRLVDAMHDVVVRAIDCGTGMGIVVEASSPAGGDIETLAERIKGRFVCEPILDPRTGETLVEAGEEIWDWAAHKIERMGVRRVCIRSVLTCEMRHGVCAKCYGHDLSTNQPVEVGTAVGILAAQSLSEAARVLASAGEDALSRLDTLLEARIEATDEANRSVPNLHTLLAHQGQQAVYECLASEVRAICSKYGVQISRKHLEILARQMLRKYRIDNPGDTTFGADQIVDRSVFTQANTQIRKQGGKEATATPLLRGITQIAQTSDSFLCAASFRLTSRTLMAAAVQGQKDELVGLKENVIIGRLIPAGTGLPSYRSLTLATPDGAPLIVEPLIVEPLKRQRFEEWLQLLTDEDKLPMTGRTAVHPDALPVDDFSEELIEGPGLSLDEGDDVEAMTQALLKATLDAFGEEALILKEDSSDEV